MNTLDGLLAGIVSEPLEETRWLVLADWLEENDDPRRGELLRLHRQLLATCCEPEQHPERAQWQSRVVELIAAGVRPCVTQHTLTLPGGIALTTSFIPPGQFLMGSALMGTNEGSQPVHKVTLTKGFFLGIHLITQAQWKAVMGTEPSRFKGPNRPVEQVSWEDCQGFCKNLMAHVKSRVTVRLPAEAEWEYACRAGTTTEYHFGDVINSELANYNGKQRQQTADVGSFLSNPWGLYDVHGNVWEWCEDWLAPYSAEDQTDPCQIERSSSEWRILRGGSWGSLSDGCRAAYRIRDSPENRTCYSGFRVCFHLD